MGYCLRTADSINLVFVPKEAYHRNLDSQQVSAEKFLEGGGGRIAPPVQVGLNPFFHHPCTLAFLWICFLVVENLSFQSEGRMAVNECLFSV